MNTENGVSASSLWLMGGTVIAIASLAIFLLAPKIVGATMGYGGDGVGQFFFLLMIGGSGLIVLVVSSVFLLLLSLMAWIR